MRDNIKFYEPMKFTDVDGQTFLRVDGCLESQPYLSDFLLVRKFDDGWGVVDPSTVTMVVNRLGRGARPDIADAVEDAEVRLRSKLEAKAADMAEREERDVNAARLHEDRMEEYKGAVRQIDDYLASLKADGAGGESEVD